MATQLPALAEVERLSPRVIRILGGNPSKFTLQGTNTYLVGTGQNRILVDSGEGSASWFRALITVLSKERATVTTILLTHWHHDHVGGIASLLTLFPTASHPPAVAARPRIFKHMPSHNPSISEAAARVAAEVETWETIDDGQTFEVEGAKMHAIHTPGHTIDHMAFFLEDENALFTGDNVLGHGTAVFEDLAAYSKSLERMEGCFGGKAYPGHGDVIHNGTAKCREYLTHRKERERQILSVMKHSGGEGWPTGWTSMEIVKVVYKDVPTNLHLPAEGGVRQVLEKLQNEGRVKEGEDSTWHIVDDYSL